MDVHDVLAADVSLRDELESGSFANGNNLDVGGRVLRLFLMFLSILGVLFYTIVQC